MISPDAAQAAAVGQSGLNKSAQTRFLNSRIAASRSGLTEAAQASKPYKYAPRNLTSPNNINTLYPSNTSKAPQSVAPGVSQNVETGSPQSGIAQMMPQSDPLESMQQDVAFEHFLSSPELQEAMSKQKLKDYFKRNDPQGAEATLARDVVQSLMSRLM